jgi:hypothetical protein
MDFKTNVSIFIFCSIGMSYPNFEYHPSGARRRQTPLPPAFC